MKLSEAIRLGAMLSQQAFGTYVDSDGSTCALAAANVAAGIQPIPFPKRKLIPFVVPGAQDTRPWNGPPNCFVLLPAEWCNVLSTTSICPKANCEFNDQLHRLIPHLNDEHNLSREEIAEFVSMVEMVCERILI